MFNSPRRPTSLLETGVILLWMLRNGYVPIGITIVEEER